MDIETPTTPEPIERIVLLEPKPPDTHIYSHFALPRLGVVLLGTILRDAGYDVTVMVEEVRDFDFDAIARADLVGISSITSTAGRAYAIGDALRREGIPVVMGGPHPTHTVDVSLQHADYVVRGEGEEALPALVRALESGSDLARVPNLSYWSDGAILHNAQAPFEEDLDRWPDPDMSLVDGFDAPGFVGNRRTIPIMTSRGCPYDCSFCSVTSTFGRRMRYRSPERVVAEMRRHDIDRSTFFIYDDNFAASPRRVREFLEAFKTLPGELRWSAQIRADMARDEELLDLMVEAGCQTVFLGLESVNQASLDSALKRQDLERTATYIDRMVARGIRVHGMFVFGFDEDTEGTMERTVAFAKAHKLWSVQFLILTPLPGSRTHRELTEEGRIMLEDYSLYDAHHVCFRPRSVTPEALQRWQVEGHDRFYSYGELLTRLWRRDFTGAVLLLYARGINRRWRRDNVRYMETIRRLSAPRAGDEPVEFRREFPDLALSLRRSLSASP